jgi:hypothetical protein
MRTTLGWVVTILGWFCWVLFVLSASGVSFAIFLHERVASLPSLIEGAVLTGVGGVVLTLWGRRIREGPDVPDRPDADD